MTMRMRATAAGAVVLALLTAPCAWADPGQTGLTFLKLGLGARAAGMGEAFSSVADDASATYWNPAGCVGTYGSEVLLNQVTWFQDVRMENVAIVRSMPEQGYGLSFTSLHAGDMDLRDIDGNDLGSFSFFDFAIQATYARRLTTGVAGGVSAKALYEKIDEETAQGFAVDLGLTADLPLPGLRLGACVQHLGSKMKYVEDSFDLPLTFRGGLAYRRMIPLLSDEAVVAFELQKPREDDLKTHLGIEVGVAEKLALRFGYRSGYDNQNVSVGVGIPVERFRLDYAFVPFYSDLGDTHRLSLAVKI
jgi:hypothetical protein